MFSLYSSPKRLETDVLELLFFEVHLILQPRPQSNFKEIAFHLPLTAGTKLLILGIKTTFRLQKPHCENF